MTYLTIFFVMFTAMLTRDMLWSVTTAFIARERWLRAAVFNSLGDGIGWLLIFLVAFIAVHSTSGSILSQVAGEMAGAFVGIICGRILSLSLDHKISWYNARQILIW